MSDLLDEVSTDIKAERSDLIIAKLVKAFFIICLLVLASVAFYAWKEHASEKLQTELSVIYNKAMISVEQNNTVEANKLLDEIIASSHQQFAVLAYLQKASLLMKENKFEEAQNILLQANTHKHFDLALRELAQVTYISNKLLDKKFQKSEIDTEIFDRITKENKPWRVLALQLKAMYMIKNNDMDGAKNILNMLISDRSLSKHQNLLTASILDSFNAK